MSITGMEGEDSVGIVLIVYYDELTSYLVDTVVVVASGMLLCVILR